MRLSRRELLRLLAAAGPAAATAAWLTGGATGLFALARQAAAEAPAAEPEAAGPVDAAAGTAAATARQWVMVTDLAKCEGCRTIGQPPQCTAACTAKHNVPCDQQWIKVYEVEEGPHRGFLPTPCMQCENAPCVDVCPVGATNGAEVVRLSKLLQDRHAYQLEEDLGTRPRVWYLPGHGEQTAGLTAEGGD